MKEFFRTLIFVELTFMVRPQNYKIKFCRIPEKKVWEYVSWNIPFFYERTKQSLIKKWINETIHKIESAKVSSFNESNSAKNFCPLSNRYLMLWRIILKDSPKLFDISKFYSHKKWVTKIPTHTPYPITHTTFYMCKK